MYEPGARLVNTKRPCESVSTGGIRTAELPAPGAPGRIIISKAIAPATPCPESASTTRPAIIPVPVGGGAAAGGACWACAIAVKTAPATATARTAALANLLRCTMGETVGD